MKPKKSVMVEMNVFQEGTAGLLFLPFKVHRAQYNHIGL